MPAFFTLNRQEIYFADLHDPAYRPPAALDGYAARVIELVREWLLGAEEFVIRTSGSTGPAKAISISRGRLAASARRSVAALKLEPGDAALVCLNVETVGGLLGLIRAVEHRLPLTVIEPVSDVLTAAGPASKFATASLVPMQIRAVLAHGDAGYAWLNRMKAVLVGGAAVPAALEEALQAVKAPVFHTYGMTETVSHVALRQLNGPEKANFFTALPGIAVRSGANDALEIRADVTGNQWLTTTDRAELLPTEGQFRWLGRLDEVINSGGVKVDAGRVRQVAEVAAATLQLPHEVLVIGVADATYGERVTLVLIGPALPPDIKMRVQTTLAEGLTRYEVPKDIRVVSTLPRLASGKPDGQQLRGLLARAETLESESSG